VCAAALLVVRPIVGRLDAHRTPQRFCAWQVLSCCNRLAVHAWAGTASHDAKLNNKMARKKQDIGRPGDRQLAGREFSDVEVLLPSIAMSLNTRRRCFLGVLMAIVAAGVRADETKERRAGRQESAVGITHSFIAFGAETYRVSGAGEVVWSDPRGTRDGFLLGDGVVVMALSKDARQYPGGAAIALDLAAGKVIFEYRGTQSEVNTVQRVGEGRYMLTEAGDKARILEVDSAGKIVLVVPIAAQTRDHHLQTRMARKLANANYLVPQLLDQVVREYSPEGKIVWEVKMPAEPKECWPFTAIRLENGDTLVTCTHGKEVIEFDARAEIVWRVSNGDLPAELLQDPCGAQRLPNGDTVIASYGQNKPGEVKLLEVTREKKVVWTYRDDKKHGIHEFQILDTNGVAVAGEPKK
jgi:hypothetical protein